MMLLKKEKSSEKRILLNTFNILKSKFAMDEENARKTYKQARIELRR